MKHVAYYLPAKPGVSQLQLPLKVNIDDQVVPPL